MIMNKERNRIYAIMVSVAMIMCLLSDYSVTAREPDGMVGGTELSTEEVYNSDGNTNSYNSDDKVIEETSTSTEESAVSVTDVSTEASTEGSIETGTATAVEESSENGMEAVTEEPEEESTEAETEAVTDTSEAGASEETDVIDEDASLTDGLEEAIVDLSLPAELNLKIDPFSVETGDPDVQITSQVYEIINYGSADVAIEIKPSIVGDGFELIEEAPDKGTQLVSENVDKARALYLAIQVADSGKNKDIVSGKYSFDITEYDQVMSTKNPESFYLMLKAADEDGVLTAESKAAIRFRGNVDPYGEYRNGDLKVSLVFNVVGISEEKSEELQEEEKEEKLNFLQEAE